MLAGSFFKEKSMMADRIEKVSRVFLKYFAWALLMGLLASCTQPSVNEGPKDVEMSTQATQCFGYSEPKDATGKLVTQGNFILKTTPKISAYSIPCPLGKCTVVDFFGPRWDDPNKGTKNYVDNVRMHNGLDLRTVGVGGDADGIGVPVRAVASGKIIAFYKNLSGYGVTVHIKHNNGFFTRYAHLDPSTESLRFALPPTTVGGQVTYVTLAQFDATKPIPVTKGQTIGKSGNTGGIGKPHLHLEYAKTSTFSGSRFDPLPCVESVEPVIKVDSSTPAPLSLSGEPGAKTQPANFLLTNSSTDQILFENAKATNDPFVTVTNPNPDYVPEGTALTVGKKALAIIGNCPTNRIGFTGFGNVSTTYYKRLQDGRKAWPLPIAAEMVDDEGLTPSFEDLSVNLTCNFNERPVITSYVVTGRSYVGGIYPHKFSYRVNYTDFPDDIAYQPWLLVFSNGSQASGRCTFSGSVSSNCGYLRKTSGGVIEGSFFVEFGSAQYVDMYVQLIDAKGQATSWVRQRAYR